MSDGVTAKPLQMRTHVYLGLGRTMVRLVCSVVLSHVVSRRTKELILGSLSRISAVLRDTLFGGRLEEGSV